MSASINGKPLTGRHVALILAAFFGVMFAVNGAFVYFALGSFSGLSEYDAYKRGLAYNEEIDHRARQIARGWQPALSFEQMVAAEGKLILSILGPDGRNLEDLEVVATIRRPVIEGTDQSLSLIYDEKNYTADIIFMGSGQWDVSILAHGGGYEEPYRLDKRIWVK
ncbi:FixH family protein [Sneathiella sp.]|uniref:FixH family protein n=1 Tax=Sneathiella sp. TaxID=1964365 RepID=UPI00261A5320|nr:FixH family protein [Sneathiella sp.]MDF2368597.1 FixH family protein [Sneathiella sp.]